MIKDRLTSPNFFIFFILLIISICIYLIIAQPGKEDNVADPDPLGNDYFDTKQPWGNTTGVDAKVRNNTGLCSLPGSSNCKVYTYYNNLGLNIVPNTYNLFEDVNNGLAHVTSTKEPVCLETNQFYAQNAKQTCGSDLGNQCIDSFGNYVNPGTSIEVTLPCGTDIPKCPGIMAAITFNFEISFENTLEKNTKFLNVNFIDVSKNNFDYFKSINNVYYQQGLFNLNNTLDDKTFLPTFSNESYDGNSFYQQFKIITYKYSSDSKEWNYDQTGPYMAIIYPPINAYLTVDVKNSNNTNFVFKSLEGANVEDTILWFFLPRLDLNPGFITKRNKFSSGNIKDLSQDSTLYNTNISNIVNFKDYFPPYSKIPNNTNYISTHYLSNNLEKSSGNYDYQAKWSFGNNGEAAFGVYAAGSAFLQSFKLDSLDISNQYPIYLFNSTNSGFANYSNEFYGLCIQGEIWDGNMKTGSKLSNDFNNISLYNESGDIIIQANFGICFPSIATFNYGDTFVDNEVTWQVLDPFAEIVVFKDNYFLSGQGDNIAKDIGLSNAGSSFYKPETKGEIVNIDFTNVQYDYSLFTDDIYTIELNTDNTSLTSGDFTSPATISLNFSAAQLDNGKSGRAITGSAILNPGAGYTNNTSFNIKATAMGPRQGSVNNITINSADEQIIFKAVALNSNNEPFNQKDLNPFIGSSFKSSGLIIPTEKVNVSTGGIFSLTSDNVSIDEINGGEGYNKGDIIYINQLDTGGNSLLGSQYNPETITAGGMSKLASVTINSTQGASFGDFNRPAPYNLLRSKINISSSSAIILNESYLQYNFWEDSPGVYNESPQQIAFIGDGLIDNMKDTIVNGTADELSAFFTSVGDSEKGFTNIDYIKTLQFAELNYIGYSESEDSELIIRNANNLSNEATLILGKFIPYRKFNPPKANGKESIPTGKSGVNFYNNNYTQILPVNLGNAYNKILSSVVSESGANDLLSNFGINS